MIIEQVAQGGLDELCALALLLWGDHEPQELRAELAGILALPEAAFYVARDQDTAVGFAQCQLRHDYVEGTESSPVGYLEGVYVQPQHRGKGVARALLEACQKWAKAMGCAEFASDCELSNQQSLRSHLKAGFKEANRIICFVKRL